MAKTYNASGIGTFEAEVTLATKQYYLVVPGTAAGQVKLATLDTDIPIGVVQNSPAANENASVRFLNDIGSCWMVADGVIALGAYVVPSLVATAANCGKIRTMTGITTETVYIVGRALEAATADGDIIEIMLLPAIQRVIS